MELLASQSIRVQIVDDQELVRAALAALIETAEGLRVVAVGGALADAVRLANESQPDIILMDVFPDAAMFQTMREIKSQCPAAKLILLDEVPQDGVVREALRVGIAGYLTKQQPFSQIEAALRLAMRGEHVFAPCIARRLVLSSDGVRLIIDTEEKALSRLTPREMDVLVYLAQGYSVRQCAEVLGIGVSTVGNHKSRLMKKLDIHKTVDLTRLAIHEGLISAGGPTRASRVPAAEQQTQST